MPQEKIYVIGHKSPDTDTVCSAIAYAEYLKKNKVNAVAAVCGDLNPETKFVLDYFKVGKPQKMTSASGKTLVLVDHNETGQMPEGADTARIIEVIDHHKISFQGNEPIKFRTEPVGSTATIVAGIMLADKFKITKQLAGILVSAILSDTVVFKSATTAEIDAKTAKTLGKIAKISNLKTFGIEIKKQKASLKGLTAEQILHSDYKEFDANGKKFAVGQIEVVDIREAKNRTAEILRQMESNNTENNLAFTVLMATDIINCGSQLLIAGDAAPIEKAFGKTCANNAIYMENMMSRKKDLLPPVMKAIG
ncbi:MAG: manganese-dependent inorganic pyrophosphatase [Candidatus Nealsonbacteria bacterium DGGOD1a]|jgi:Inorganic pyrophosphatase/exopolyphosphatase|nr:MAG: manganese-dependent inorganic pyrophosphatase [Candidatus Nealsonbacteria bacterium DGGOD1a]